MWFIHLHGIQNKLGLLCKIVREMFPCYAIFFCILWFLESLELVLNFPFHFLCRFAERGKIYNKQEVRAIQTGPGSIFFTGDGTGLVRVWNWIVEPATATASNIQ